MSPGAPFHIRPAMPEDVGILLQLIEDLATYEGKEEVKATPELLRRYLFETPHAHSLLAFSGPSHSPQDAIGYAVYFFNYSTWTGRPGLYLEDLYVRPEYRRNGVGSELFGRLGEIAQEKNCARLDWVVLKWNQPSIDFYEKTIGANCLSEWSSMRLDEEDIASLRRFARATTLSQPEDQP